MAARPNDALPNIVVIMTDDQDLTMGSLDTMPQLQQALVQQGMSFSNFYLPQSLCCPSRVSFLRGQYTHNHQVYTNLPPLGGFDKAYSLGLEQSTIATTLKQAGYRTALVGKYLNGYPLDGQVTYIPPGWDYWFSPITEDAYGSYNYLVNDNGQVVGYGSSRTDYITDVLTGKALSFLDSTASDEPFFLLLTYYAPHSPANPAQRHIALFPDAEVPRTPSFDEADVSDKPTFLQMRPLLTITETKSLDWQYRRRLQSLQAVDEGIGAVIDALQRSNRLDQTYLFFLSDNGYHLGQHRLPPGKGSPYEEDIHGPLVVRGPGVPAAASRDELVAMIDLAPTLAELGGGALGHIADGRSLVPLLHSLDPAPAWRQSLLIEAYLDPHAFTPTRPANWEPPDTGDATMAQPSYTALHTGRYIYVEYSDNNRELYDLQYDPYEVSNRWRNASAAMRSQLADYLATLRTCEGAFCRIADLAPPPDYQIEPRRVFLPALQRINPS